MVIARGDKLKLQVYTSVSCFFRIFCMIGVTSFLGNFAREIDVQPVIDIDPPANALRLTAASAH